jgi:putative SOS response-associated peptidase YedK
MLSMMFWRFLPPFVTDPKMFKMTTIKAKSETLLDSSVWKDSFLRRRCLVPVDSFVEWRTEGKRKLPWMFGMSDDEPFALGGVWRHWRSRDGQSQMDTFAIITTEPNELLVEKTGHDRMPAIIKKADYQRWLEPGTDERPPVDLLRPFDSEKMKAWRVDPKINNVRNNEPSLSEPLKEDEPGGQMGMF